MFDIGFWELALISALGLIVLGPEKLPRVAGQLGRYVAQARRMARSLSHQLQQEIDAADHPPQQAAPPTPASYSRPGVSSLIPGESADAPTATPADGKPDGRGTA